MPDPYNYNPFETDDSPLDFSSEFDAHKALKKNAENVIFTALVGRSASILPDNKEFYTGMATGARTVANLCGIAIDEKLNEII